LASGLKVALIPKKLFILSFSSIVVAVFAIFVSLRLETILRNQLPRYIQAEALKISLIAGGFTLENVSIFARDETLADCSGKKIFSLESLSGNFKWWGLKLKSLVLTRPRMEIQNLGCLRTREPKKLERADWLNEDGLKIEIARGEFDVPDFGPVDINSKFIVRPIDMGFDIASEMFVAANKLVILRVSKLSLSIVEQKIKAEALATLEVPDLSALKRLKTKALTVESGSGEAKLSLGLLHGEITAYTNIELKRLRVRGEPLNKMPLGLLEVTPQILWPMAEDKPGFFAFSFRTRTKEQRLVKDYVADFKKAFVNKFKLNLKKKIPILPF